MSPAKIEKIFNFKIQIKQKHVEQSLDGTNAAESNEKLSDFNVFSDQSECNNLMIELESPKLKNTPQKMKQRIEMTSIKRNEIFPPTSFPQ